jgi:phthiodiolone/phenolphthiodiolone dimycocerosates ketoreductase
VKAYDAARDPVAIIPAVNRTIVTGRSRDDVDEALDSVIVKASALAAPAEAWARHGVAHPLGADFSGVQDLVPQTIDKQTCRLPGRRDQFGAGFAMSMGPPVCH